MVQPILPLFTLTLASVTTISCLGQKSQRSDDTKLWSTNKNHILLKFLTQWY